MISTNNSPEPSESLSELITALTEGERATFNQTIRSANLLTEDFKPISSWTKDCYTRNCIAQNEKFELILICWEKEQATPIHDHGGEECWVRVVKGEFKETIYKNNEEGELNEVTSNSSSIGDVTYMIDFMGYHRLQNVSDERGMTLHLYAKPIRTCNVYDEEENVFVSKEMSYDTVSELSHI